jgi:predicted RNase H-like nuclease (RuvC/YqgF family)
MTMEKKSAKKVEKLIKLVEKLKVENEKLKREINEKNFIIENFKKKT